MIFENFTVPDRFYIYLMSFFIYCFIGWVWETIYMSIVERKPVNRGFMKGPFLPIYGVGAFNMIFSTLSVRDSIVLTFLLGMIASTILEYVTGTIMEMLFHVRYWDYSNDFLNYKGRICFKACIAWGVGTVFLVNFLQVAVEDLIALMPYHTLTIIVRVLIVYFIVDFTSAFKDALDFRMILETITSENERINKIVAELSELKSRAGEGLERMKEGALEKAANGIKKVPGSAYMSGIKANTMERVEKLEALLAELNEKNKLRFEAVLHSRVFRRSLGIIKRNNIVASERYKKALEKLKGEKDKK